MCLGISRLRNNAIKLNEPKNYVEISNLIVHLGISRLKNNTLKLNGKQIVFKKSNLTKLFTISSRRNKYNFIYLCELSDYCMKKPHKKIDFPFFKEQYADFNIKI